MTSPPPQFIIKPDGDLASRLRCIASFAVVAKAMGVVLQVYWPTDTDSLFEPTSLFSSLPSTTGPSRVFEWVSVHTWDTARDRDDSVHLEQEIPYLRGNYLYSTYKIRSLFTTAEAVTDPNAFVPIGSTRPTTFCYTARCTREWSERNAFVLALHVPLFQEEYVQVLRKWVPRVTTVLQTVETVRRSNGLHTCGALLGVYDACETGGDRETATLEFISLVEDHLDNVNNCKAIVVTDDISQYATYENDDRVVILPRAPRVATDGASVEVLEAQWVQVQLLQYAHSFHGGVRCPATLYVAEFPFCGDDSSTTTSTSSPPQQTTQTTPQENQPIPMPTQQVQHHHPPCTALPEDAPSTQHHIHHSHSTPSTCLAPEASTNTESVPPSRRSHHAPQRRQPNRLPVYPHAHRVALPGFWYPPTHS